MMKRVWLINQYASTLDCGFGGRCYYFARELALKGYDVYVIASATHHLLRRRPTFEGDFYFETVDGFKFVWLRGLDYSGSHDKRRIINEFDFSKKIKKFAKLFNSSRPDFILYSSPSLYPSIAAEKVATRLGAKFILDIRDLWPLTLTELGVSVFHPYVIFLQYVENYIYKKADRVISNWPYAIDYMINHGLSPEKFTWIPNGFSIDEFSKSNILDELVSNKIPTGKFILGYAGTLGKANALHTLIDAAKIISDNFEIHIVVAGDGNLKSELMRKAECMGLQNITFLGSVKKSQIPSLLKIFDACYVGFLDSPLYKYGSSLTKLPEYMASGRPIIYASNSKFQPVSDAGAGFTISAENPVELANAILNMSRCSQVERDRMGDCGKKAAINIYEYSSLASKLLKCI